MNMGFMKIVYVLTLLIIVMIINYHKSNANYCIDQLTQDGEMDINFNSTDAFKYAYLNYNNDIIEEKNKFILKYYFNKLFIDATAEYSEDMVLNLNTWQDTYNKNSETKSPFFGTLVDNVSSKNTLRYAYFEMIDYFIDDELKEYYSFMLEAFLPYVAASSAEGPLSYCEKYTVLKCKEQLKNIANIDMGLTGRDAFFDVYFNQNILAYQIQYDIVYQYIYDFFLEYAPALKNLDNIFHFNPMDWCMYKLPIDMNDKQWKCHNLLQSSIFANNETFMESFYFAYHYIRNTDDMCEMFGSYYQYIFTTFLTDVVISDEDGPIHYCETHFPSATTTDDNQSDDDTNVDFHQLQI